MAIENWKPTTDKTDLFVKALVYGSSGIGKTSLVRTLMHRGYKPVFFNTDKGQNTLISYLQSTNATLPIVKVVPTYDDSKTRIVRSAWEIFVEDYREVTKQVKMKKCPYDTIVLDSITELVTYLKDDLMWRKDKTAMMGEEKMLTQHDYLIVHDRIKKLLRELRDLEINVFVVSLITEETNDLKQITVRPNIQKKLNIDSLGYFDEVYFMDLMEVQDPEKGVENRRVLFTQPAILPGRGNVYAKTRSNKVKSVESADLGRIFNMILGRETPTQTEVQQVEIPTDPSKATDQVSVPADNKTPLKEVKK